MAAIGACAGFGSIGSSSLAAAATMEEVALPELRRAGYAGSLTTSALAAGRTLGILISPWILVLIVVEVGLIMPPVGMNLFVIQQVAPDIPIRETCRGMLPSAASDMIRVIVLVLFPSITQFVLRFST